MTGRSRPILILPDGPAGIPRMRLSIQRQILIPLIAIQGVAVGAVTAATATLAARQGERRVIERLNGVVEALGRSNFPYTPGVLGRMKGLTGAEFLAYGADGRVAATSFADGVDGPPAFGAIARAARLESLGDSPIVRLGGVRYFAVPLPGDGRIGGDSLLVLFPESSWRQAGREAATLPLAFGAGSLAAMAAVTSWIAHRIGRRIREVQAHVARIADGDFEGFDPGADRDEVSDLARSVNSLTRQLREMRRTIRESERTRVLAQLAAGLAHQLRNSLTGARMSVQLHARRNPVPAGDRSLEVALKQLAMTEEQVKGLLSLGRVEGRPPTRVDVDRLLGEIALLVGPACEHARVSLDVRDEGALAVRAEESGLRSAILNLALNAVEAAGRGGAVRLEAFRDGDRVAVEVSDTGPGPPAWLEGALFEPFATGKPEGVGLGLALARQVADRHGGTLTWGRVDRESRFRLTLPATAGAARGDA
jgi:signal transduction histidine kinase